MVMEMTHYLCLVHEVCLIMVCYRRWWLFISLRTSNVCWLLMMVADAESLTIDNDAGYEWILTIDWWWLRWLNWMTICEYSKMTMLMMMIDDRHEISINRLCTTDDDGVGWKGGTCCLFVYCYVCEMLCITALLASMIKRGWKYNWRWLMT